MKNLFLERLANGALQGTVNGKLVGSCRLDTDGISTYWWMQSPDSSNFERYTTTDRTMGEKLFILALHEAYLS